MSQEDLQEVNVVCPQPLQAAVDALLDLLRCDACLLPVRSQILVAITRHFSGQDYAIALLLPQPC